MPGGQNLPGLLLPPGMTSEGKMQRMHLHLTGSYKVVFSNSNISDYEFTGNCMKNCKINLIFDNLI